MPEPSLSRRAAILGSFAAAPMLRSWPAHGSPGEDRVAFEILRHGSVIGTHAVLFQRSGRTLRAHIDCRMHVGFGPFTVFRYRHQGVELWEDGVFQTLETSTDNNGSPLAVSARRTEAGVDIRARGAPPTLAPAGALPLTHWNLACMSAPLFNPQDGTLIHEAATCAGPDTITLGDGSRIAATRYALKGAAPIDDWYDGGRAWIALRATVKDGSVLQYRRV